MSHPFYQTKEWRRLRALCLRRDVYCQVPGCHRPATHADHIIPRGQGGPDMLANLRGLCVSCHNRRSMSGNAEPHAIGCRPDGTPLDHTHWWNR